MTHTNPLTSGKTEEEKFIYELQSSNQVEELLKSVRATHPTEEEAERMYRDDLIPEEAHLYAWDIEGILDIEPDSDEEETRRCDLFDDLERHADQASDLAGKKLYLEQIRIGSQYKQALEEQAETEKLEKFQIEGNSANQIEEYCQKLDRLRSISSEKGNPLSATFGSIPFFFLKSMTGISAGTGNGKSSLAGGIAVSMAEEGKRVLFISNEESAETQLLRAACISTGIPFGGVTSFSEREYALLKQKMTEIDKRVRCLDDFSAGPPGLFSTIEGWEKFLDKFEKDDAIKKYDLLLIDYYQGVFSSKRRPSMKDSEVQSMFVQRLERFREEVGIPIIIFVQLWDKKGTF